MTVKINRKTKFILALIFICFVSILFSNISYGSVSIKSLDGTKIWTIGRTASLDRGISRVVNEVYHITDNNLKEQTLDETINYTYENTSSDRISLKPGTRLGPVSGPGGFNYNATVMSKYHDAAYSHDWCSMLCFHPKIQLYKASAYYRIHKVLFISEDKITLYSYKGNENEYYKTEANIKNANKTFFKRLLIDTWRASPYDNDKCASYRDKC